MIRNATLKDISEIAKLHVDSWNKTYNRIIAKDYLDNMKNNIDRRIKRMEDEFNIRKII